MTNNLTISCELNTDKLPLANQPRSGQVEYQTAPVNLGLVVDVSDSMLIRLVTEAQFVELASAGLAQEVLADGVPAWRVENIPQALIHTFPRKIDFVIEALRVVLERLRPQDGVSLSVFASQAQLLLPCTSGRDKGQLLRAIADLERLSLGDDTYMGRGMELGYETMMDRSLPASTDAGSLPALRMVLLTDGFTRDIGDCWRWAERAQADGIAISSIGLGGEFNEELLIPMAERTGGRSYYVQEPSQLTSVFRQELQAAQSIGCRDAELKLQLTPGVELRRAHWVKPYIGRLETGKNKGGSYSMPLGDLENDAPPSWLLELIVPPRNAGKFRIAQVLLSGDPVDAKRQTVRQDIVVEFMAESGAGFLQKPQLLDRVMDVVERVSAFDLQTRALKDAASGNIAGATRKLEAAATRLLDMGEDELAHTARKQAVALGENAQLDAGATKRLRYGTRKL